MLTRLIRVLLTLFSCCTFVQANNLVEVFVQANGGLPAKEIAVFYFDGSTNYIPNTIQGYASYKYTDARGKATFNIPANVGSFQSLGICVVDCKGNFIYQDTSASIAGGVTNLRFNMNISCLPSSCQTVVEKTSLNGGRQIQLEAISLHDTSIYSGIPIHNKWTFSDSTVAYGHKVIKDLSRMPVHSISYCFSKSPSCSWVICDTIKNLQLPGAVSCDARWSVDTVNSMAFDGHIVIWNHGNGSGHYTNFYWDFGDGHTSTDRFPKHHYQDTGVYKICLEVKSVRGSDTCFTAHCNSVGMDHNGELIHKNGGNGFTINVIDPTSIGTSEFARNENTSIYPNPARDLVTLSNRDKNIERLKLYDLQGRIIMEKNWLNQSTERNIALDNIKVGTYIVKLHSKENVETLRLVIKD